MASPNVKFETVPTPNPNEVAVRVWQDANQMGLATIPTLGALYSQNKITVTPRLRDFSDYKYADMEKEGDKVWFYFVKPKTDTEKGTPFRITYSTRQYPWPGVLYGLNIYETTTFPQTVNTGTGTVATAPRYFAKYRYKPTPNVSSVIRVEEYLSDTPYEQSTLTHDQPIATDINGNFLGLTINIPRCLHPQVIFDSNIPDGELVVGQGTTGTPRDFNPSRQVFPATNFEDWAEFVIDDDVKLVNGQYYRNKVWIFPPIQPDDILI